MAYTPSLGAVELHTRRLSWLPELQATLLDEYPYGVGRDDLRWLLAALETLHGIPEHHRSMALLVSDAEPALQQWCRKRADQRAAQKQDALSRLGAAKAA